MAKAKAEGDIMKTTYLVLFVVGCVLPLSQLAPWLAANGGLDVRLFLADLFANRISGFFALDVVVSAVVVLLWTWDQWRRGRLSRPMLPVLATLLVGVSAGLPLALYLRREDS
jgi:hypothetical protein